MHITKLIKISLVLALMFCVAQLVRTFASRRFPFSCWWGFPVWSMLSRKLLLYLLCYLHAVKQIIWFAIPISHHTPKELLHFESKPHILELQILFKYKAMSIDPRLQRTAISFKVVFLLSQVVHPVHQTFFWTWFFKNSCLHQRTIMFILFNFIT